MSSLNFPWVRYWYAQNQAPYFYDGLLYVYDSEYKLVDKNHNSNQFVELHTLLHIPCLILLGEPGMGKTSALQESFRRLNENGEDLYILHNLADLETADELTETVFEDEKLVAWQQDNSILHLFLDSLDEARIHIRTITTKLTRFFKQNVEHLPRLRLRIACREPNWTTDFEEELKDLWGENNVSRYVLAPLQRKDIVQAAQLFPNIGDAQKFVRELYNKDMFPLGARPVTLLFLLREYAQTSQFPRTRRKLYERGCKTLCREINNAHVKEAELEPEQRFIIAARLAAIMIFCGVSAIQLDGTQSKQSDTVSAEMFADGLETFPDTSFPIYESSIKETLNTALFTGTSTKRWSHHTYAEFLAAWYVDRFLSVPQIKSLIIHPDGKLIPQLYGTTSWLASFNAVIFDLVLESDPEVLLQSDITSDDEPREKLLQALLQWKIEHPHQYLDWKYIERLKNSRMEETLRTFLQNQASDMHAKNFALSIAIICEIDGLQDLMTAIALDEEEELLVRNTAAEGVVKLGDLEHKVQLKPLALLPIDSERACRQLKKFGISATWPHTLTAQELFSQLWVSSKQDDLDQLTSTYENWYDLIIPELTSEDLPVALSWVRHQKPHHELDYGLSELIDAIIHLSWKHLNEPKIADEFAKTIIAMWQRYDSIVTNPHSFTRIHGKNASVLTREIVQSDDTKRYQLLHHLLSIIIKGLGQLESHLVFDVPLLSFRDAPQIITYFDNAQSDKQKAIVARLLSRIIDLYNLEQFEFIYNIGLQNNELWKQLGFKLFYEIDSKEAENARQIYKQRKEMEVQREQYKQRQTKVLLEHSPQEKVLELLEQIENGEPDKWWQVSLWLGIDIYGQYSHSQQYEYDVCELPTWNKLTYQQHQRIIDTASNYILNHNPNDGYPANWRGERDKIYYPIVAGTRAFFLLIRHEQVNHIPEKEWRKWAPALIYYVYHFLTNVTDENRQRQAEAFIKRFKAVASKETIETFLWIAKNEDQNENFFLPSRMDNLWDAELVESFMEEITADRFSINMETTIIRSICNFHFEYMHPLLTAWFANYESKHERSHSRAILAAQLLFAHTDNGSWNSIWPVVKNNKPFGREVIEKISLTSSWIGREAARVIGTKLTEEAIADLYLWMMQEFTEPEYQQRKGEITQEQRIAETRDSLPSVIAILGTRDGINQLRRLQDMVDQELDYAIQQATLNYLKNTWNPPTINEFKQLVQLKNSRFIQSESQLLEVLLELLPQLDLELQGKANATSSAIDLWNEYRKTDENGNRSTYWTPKDENRLSDYIERYLKRVLEGTNIFVGRENQVERGQFTDIHIETHPLQANDQFGQPLKVIIEVKGCWHRELKTAMEDQLKNRYLQENGLYYGIYLVGWFMCDKWSRDDDESRWNASSRVNDLETDLKEQAKRLSVDGYSICPLIINASL